MIDRRSFFVAAAAPLLGTSALAAPDLAAAARDAFIFTLPLMEVARTRHVRTATTGLNRLNHSRQLADWQARVVTTPNNDTLYSTAQLDLSRGPATLTVPDGRRRYVSVALMDAYSNNFAVLGTRTTPAGGTFVIAPPGGRPGPGVIVSPTDHVWCLGRTLVASPEDFAAARAAAEQITLQAPQDVPPPPAIVARDAPWQAYLAQASQLLRLNPPPAADAAMLARIAPLGLVDGFQANRFSAADGARIAAGLEQGRSAVRGGMAPGGYIDGWGYPKENLGNFGQDYLYRAQVALGGLAALPLDEAMYMFAEGDAAGGRHFSPGRRLNLHLPADRQPPVDAFWSLSMYEATPEGQFFFVRNPIDRYAIGDRTPGLKRNADGSLDIWIGADDPGPERRSNWLPAPDGPFQMNFRAYLPRREFRTGAYRLPRLRPA
ncbi:DUF1254 domain-containing protein [Phenylobacterium sp. VNQ135]|uniref:DUF1254 domain-containing protein n=1 Tax=Phenylobacterium sp. VNQ135 TaxID=3400922 RepID=UPI003C002A14